LVALFVLLTSLSAEAKKKKPAKKHKTPAASSKSKSKSSAPAEAAPESDEASSDEKTPSPSKTAAEPDEEEKPAKAAAPPAEPDEEAAAKKPPKKAAPAAAAEGESAAGAPIALSFGVGGKALFRNLSWTSDMGALAPYNLAPGPEASLWLEAYPAAFMTDGFAANIGLYGGFDYGLGASSKVPSTNTKLDTKYQDFLAGLKVRIPLGMALPYLAVGYGMQKFHLDPPDATRPNFNYSFVSLGGGARFQFLPIVYADVSAAFLYVMNPGSAAGEVAGPGLYTRATANGVDVALSVGVRVYGPVGLRAGGDFRQFGVATNWKTGDATIKAGGATDRNISAWGGVEIELDGGGGGGGGGEAEAPAAKKPAGKAKKPAPRDVEPDEAGGSSDADE